MRFTISALMLTTRRRWMFAQLAVETWLLNARDPGDELVIVSEDEIDLGFAHPRVRVCRIDPQPTLADKRNRGVELCRNPWVAFWDDDDWHGTSRILRLREALFDGNGIARKHRGLAPPGAMARIYGGVSYLIHELTGLRRTFDWAHGRDSLISDPEPYVVGGTMMFYRQIALDIPFVEQVTRGDEGWWTLERLREGLPFKIVHTPYVAMIHGDNTCARTPRVDEHGFVMSDHQMRMLPSTALQDILPAPVLARYVLAAFAQSDPHDE